MHLPGRTLIIISHTQTHRPNLFYCVQDKPADNEGALKALARFILGEHRGQSGIVYCFSQKEVGACGRRAERVWLAGGRHLMTYLLNYTPRNNRISCDDTAQSEKVAEALNQHSITAAAYHAGE